MTIKPAKYDHKHFNWYDKDGIIGCTKKVVRCPAGYKGHLTSHLNQNVTRMVNKELELQVIKKVAHSHFTHEFDLGRHTTCEIGRTWIPARLCQTEWVLHKKTLPVWIRNDLYGE